MAKISQLDLVGFKDAVNANKKAVIYFYSEWVAQCRAMKGVMETVADMKGNEITFGSVSVETLKELFVIYEVSAVPTVIVFIKGEPLKKIEGFLPANELVQEINSVENNG